MQTENYLAIEIVKFRLEQVNLLCDHLNFSDLYNKYVCRDTWGKTHHAVGFRYSDQKERHRWIHISYGQWGEENTWRWNLWLERIVLQECLLGRGEGCDIRIQLPVVSKEHARIKVQAVNQQVTFKLYLENFFFALYNVHLVNRCTLPPSPKPIPQN